MTRPYRHFVPLVALAALAVFLAPPALAQDKRAVDLELVLAADGSGSIDDDELRLQREGYGLAMMHPRVLEAIQFGPNGRIAVAYVEWGAPDSQHTIVDWRIIADLGSARQFADALIAAPRAAFGYNSISNALIYAADLIHDNDIASHRKIIDVSADAGNFGGVPIELARDTVVQSGVTINGLAIARQGSGRPGGANRGYGTLENYFAQVVIGGAGAFVVVAGEELSFAQAVQRKLILEIAADTPTGPDRSFAAAN
ncbi:MAG: DUF1194 domain-containing protein [Proteobacteria bacterium]|nr:DUF1194 domain-containing protein [Pseudomonadota bacterium]